MITVRYLTRVTFPHLILRHNRKHIDCRRAKITNLITKKYTATMQHTVPISRPE